MIFYGLYLVPEINYSSSSFTIEFLQLVLFMCPSGTGMPQNLTGGPQRAPPQDYLDALECRKQVEEVRKCQSYPLITSVS